jgi:hypothetical protein
VPFDMLYIIFMMNRKLLKVTIPLLLNKNIITNQIINSSKNF